MRSKSKFVESYLESLAEEFLSYTSKEASEDWNAQLTHILSAIVSGQGAVGSEAVIPSIKKTQDPENPVQSLEITLSVKSEIDITVVSIDALPLQQSTTIRPELEKLSGIIDHYFSKYSGGVFTLGRIVPGIEAATYKISVPIL